VAMILVVDDDPTVRALLATLLETRGHVVEQAPDGRSALDRLAHLKPDLVFLDLQMPGVSGMEVLSTIRELHPRLPVVVISGWADEELARESLQAGAYEFLAKPFDLQAIELRLVEKLEMAESGAD